MSNSPSNPDNTLPANELPSRYRPIDHEDRIRARWDAEKAFAADPNRVLSGAAKPYTILIPPPNVTAQLHLGHALNNTLQDILTRAKRMQGFEALWMPGTDHAGIATQAVVEKRVMKEEKKRRNQFTREEFVAKIQAFKDEYEAIITDQLKRMGCSCDWDRQRFTMDPVCAKAVREAFFILFRDGLIYRGKRLVNWDPALQTAVADDECYDEEIDAAFYYLRYPLVHGSTVANEDPQPVTWNELARRNYPGAADQPGEQQAWVTVATTRPETYLGDTAVAINPHDPRAMALRGLFAELPLVGRAIPIVEDSYVVLPKSLARNEEEANDPKAAFATGFLKVTPAHDTNDYELGQRHKLNIINMMSPDGRVSDKHGWTDIGDAHIFVGKSMTEARKLVVKEFEARGWFEKQVPYRHSVKHSDRSKAIIEPYLSDQWYVRVTDSRLAESANAAMVKSQRTTHKHEKSGRTPAPGDGTMTFHPERYAKSYEHWHDNIRDWCISRQLWWGHRIPVWSLPDEAPPKINDFSRSLAALPSWIREGRISGTVFGHPLTERGIELDVLAKHSVERGVYICVRDPEDHEIISQLEMNGFVQDSDVLDTWFSSALWPISTMGWPDAKSAGAEFAGLLQAFNPTSTLCTAREIITLWVSRMVMFNRYFLPETGAAAANAESRMPNASGSGRGPIPFHDVFIHPVIQDGEGRKMSKSLGNGVDPLDIIATHGADAMRFTLCQMCTETQDIRMPVQKDSATGKNTSPKFDLGRNFCNKLWNASRFALGILNAPGAAPASGTVTPSAALSLPDRWMLSRLAAGAAEVNAALNTYEFSKYAQTLYDLLWRDFCDWYLEAIKPTVAADAAQRTVLIHALETIVRLLHPIAPFVTESLFEHLKQVPRAKFAGIEFSDPRKAGLLCTAGWPTVAASLRDEAAERTFERMRSIITAIREVRAQQQIKPSRRLTLHAPATVDLAEIQGLLATLGGLDAITTASPSGPSATFSLDGAEYRLSNLADAVNEGAEKARIQKQIADLEKSVATLEARLANPGYADRAPPAMVQQSRDQLAKVQGDLAAARASLAKLG